nr:isoleucine--tRNA ligase [Tanacetum cinerariifolium]
MKKYRERQKDLHMAFLDLEKAYDSVPRELVWRTLRDKRTPRRYSRVIKDMVEVAELRMLRWTCSKTMVDMIPNGVFRAELNVDSIIGKMREGRLIWFGHVRRRPQSASVRRVEAMLGEGSRRRGRPKLRWEDRLKQGMKGLLLGRTCLRSPPPYPASAGLAYRLEGGGGDDDDGDYDYATASIRG